MNARLKDVAAHAGVSVKTVSNVVNDYPFVSPATRARVRASLDELRYRPNATARSLRTGRTGMIGLAVPRLRDAYFAEIADQVVNAAEERGWTVLVEQTGGDARREAALLTGLRPSLVDGLIFSPLALDQPALDQAVRRTPVVLLGEHLEGADRPRVAIDNVAAARDAVLHLAGTGRTRIAAVGAKPGRQAPTAALRLAGYRAGLTAAGLAERSYYEAAVTHYQRLDGAEAARRLLRCAQRPDALVCFNDLLALGALRALHEARVRVPDDVAVVGFDDITESSYAIPDLTSVAPDKSLLAHEAVRLLAGRIDDPTCNEATQIVVPHRVIVRGSTSPSAASPV
jgi:DNA-binding LacI/PurR family transcriptional regulator